jgi:predicted RNA methylase
MELNDRISFLQAKVPFSNFSLSRDHSQPQRNSNNNHRHKNGGRIGGRSRSNQQQRKLPSNAAATTRNVTTAIDTVHSIVESTITSMDGMSIIDSISNDRPRFPLHDKCVDTVMTNPPFGTKGNNAGIDIEFVLLACQLARRAVYSFHKTTTRDYVLRTIQTNVSNIKSVSVIAEMKFNISNTYQFHQQKSVDIEVDLIRVELLHP